MYTCSAHAVLLGHQCWCGCNRAALLLLQHDYTFDEVSAKCAAGAKLCRLVRLRPLTNLLTSTGVNSSRGLLLVTLVSRRDVAGLTRGACGQRDHEACLRRWC